MRKNRFQFHLSTALIAHIFGGAFVGLSIQSYDMRYTSRDRSDTRCESAWGWPIRFYQNMWVEAPDPKNGVVLETQTNFYIFLADIGFFIALACLMEFIVHRHAKRLTNSAENEPNP